MEKFDKVKLDNFINELLKLNELSYVKVYVEFQNKQDHLNIKNIKKTIIIII